MSSLWLIFFSSNIESWIHSKLCFVLFLIKTYRKKVFIFVFFFNEFNENFLIYKTIKIEK